MSVARRGLPAVVLLAVALVVAIGTTSADAAVVPADATVTLSGAPDLLSLLPAPAGAARIADGQAIDAAAGEVAFSSTSDGLLAGDDDDVENVYVKDLASGAVQLASVAPDGQPSHVDCHDAALSRDGTHVAFVCDGPLDPADVNGRADVYERDLTGRTTALVSRASDGTLGDASSLHPAISADGSFVAFESAAGTFGAPGGVARVWRRDLAQHRTVLVSQASGIGSPPISVPATSPSISDDGNRIAFQTTAALDAARDANQVQDVYLRDVGAAVTLPVSTQNLSVNPPTGDGPAGQGFVSGDGTAVYFVSSADNLGAAGDKDATPNLYVKQLLPSGEVTALRAVAPGGEKVDGPVLHGASANGSCAVFTVGGDAYVDDGGDALLVSTPSAGAPSFGGVLRAALGKSCDPVVLGVDHGLTSDVMPDLASVVLRGDVQGNGTLRTVSRPPGGDPFFDEGGDARDATLSADGRYAAFVATAPGFGAPPGQAVVLRRDLLTGDLVTVSIGPDGNLLPIPAAARALAVPRISGDGRHVVFLARDPETHVQHAYVRDLSTDPPTTLIADRVDGTDEPSDHDAANPTISDDGSRIAFATPARLDPNADTDMIADVYVRDLRASPPRTLLADVATPALGGVKAVFAIDPTISGDGRSVAFETFTPLASPDADDFSDDVYVRDVDAGTTTLASVAGQSTKGDHGSFEPSISRDGTRVAFLSFAGNFGTPSPGEALYVRDIAAGTLTLASQADTSAGAPVAVLDRLPPVISADGAHVAFAAAPATPIAPGAPGDGVARLYERDLAGAPTAGATRLISRASGAAGAPSAALALDGALLGVTADGGCVAFDADGSLLAPPASTDHGDVFLRAVLPNCGRPIPPPPPGTDTGTATGTGTGTGPGSAGPAVLRGLSLRPAHFHVGGRTGGTRIAFRLDKGSAVTLTFDRLLGGRRPGRRCLTTVRKGRRCTVVRRAGHITVSRARAGASTVRFSGKLGRHALAPGTYRLTATPLHGRPRTVRFVVVKAPKPKRKVHR